MNSHETDFEIFSKNELFRNFKLEEIKNLYAISKPVVIERGETLIQEGEIAKDLFLIISGTVEVSKETKQGTSSYLIQTASSGELIGEVAFIDRGFRSATVTCKTNCILRSIPFTELEQFINRSPEYSQAYIHLSKNISEKLRNTNNLALAALKNEALGSKFRVRMGIFLIYIISSLCLVNFGLDAFQQLIDISRDYAYYMILTIILGTGLIYLMKLSAFSWEDFGITLKNWRRSLLEGVLFTLPILGLILAVKWTLLHSDFLSLKQVPLFEPFALFTDPADKNWNYWLRINIFYVFIASPIQELLTRGALQGLLERFLPGKYRVLLAIFLSNLMFSTIQVYISLHYGTLVFLFGLFLGWLYSRTHNLLGCSIAHAMLGIGLVTLLGELAIHQKF